MVLQVILRRKTTSFISENIHLNRTKGCKKNKWHMPKRAQMTTLMSFAHSLASQKKWIFLLGQISPSASSTRDLGRRLPSDPNNNSYTLGHLKGGTHAYRPPLSLNSHKLLFSYKIRQTRVGKWFSEHWNRILKEENTGSQLTLISSPPKRKRRKNNTVLTIGFWLR